MPLTQWRDIRKEYFNKMINDWVDVFRKWMDSGYEVGLYVIYKDLMDAKKGPRVIKKMANLLNEAGFSIVDDDDDLCCVWYNGVSAGNIREYHQNSK